MMKKGQLSIGNNILVVGVLILVVAGFIAALGANMNEELGSDFDSGSIEENITVDANEGIENISTKFDLVGTILVMVFLLSLIFLAVAVFQRK